MTDEIQRNGLTQRVSHVETQLNHVSASIAGLEAKTSSHGDVLSDVKKAQAAILDAVNKPPAPTNVWAVVMGVIGLVTIIASFVTLNLAPVQRDIDKIAGRLISQGAVIGDRGTQLGSIVAQQDRTLYDMRHMDDGFHQLDARLRKVEVAIDSNESASAVSRRAIGDYMKEHVNSSARHK